MEKRFAQQQFKKNPRTPEEKLVERLDYFKAIREASVGHVPGAELEMHQEGVAEFERSNIVSVQNSIVFPSSMFTLKKRAYAEVDTTAGAGFIPTDVAAELNIVRTPNIMDKLGVTVYDQLRGNLKLPNMAQLNAAFVAEKSAVDTSGATPGNATLAPRRVGSGDNFSKELFIQTSPTIQAGIMRDFMDAIWRAIQKDGFQAVAAGGTIITGYAITDTVAALDHDAILGLESGIETDYDGLAYLMSPKQRAKLKALVIGGAGSGRFAWENNEVNGYGAFASNSIAATNGGSTNTAYDVVFGLWRALVVGLWGGMELIVDPYGAAKTGEYIITANALADTAVANALSFSVIRNADI
jgi:hypothetical protein